MYGILSFLLSHACMGDLKHPIRAHVSGKQLHIQT